MYNYNELLNKLLNMLHELQTQFKNTKNIKINTKKYTDTTIIQVDLTDFCTSEFIIVFGTDVISFYRNGLLIVTGLLNWCSYEIFKIIVTSIYDICDDF